jgi:hypothetical protein
MGDLPRWKPHLHLREFAKAVALFILLGIVIVLTSTLLVWMSGDEPAGPRDQRLLPRLQRTSDPWA